MIGEVNKFSIPEDIMKWYQESDLSSINHHDLFFSLLKSYFETEKNPEQLKHKTILIFKYLELLSMFNIASEQK